MSIISQLCFLLLLAACDLASAKSSCTHSEISMRVGEVFSANGYCTLDSDCTDLDLTVSYPANGGYPLNYGRAITAASSELDATKYPKLKMTSKFRGFDNYLAEGKSTIESFVYKVKCGNSSEWADLNFTVQMSPSTLPIEAAAVPPSKISVPCLVENVETSVLMSFSTSNVDDHVRTYRSLVSGWKKGDHTTGGTYAFSRPSSATSKSTTLSSTNTHRYDAGSQPILRSIQAGPNDYSLSLNLKPPSSGGVASWTVCIIPGDGYNWFPEVCTEDFAVRSSQEKCDAIESTTTVPLSGASALSSWQLILSIFMSALLQRAL